MELPNSADIVIIGGGVMGASALYHLAARGTKNVVLLEKEGRVRQGAALVACAINFPRRSMYVFRWKACR
jgi:sarcosine oxidase, subunit beta